MSWPEAVFGSAAVLGFFAMLIGMEATIRKNVDQTGTRVGFNFHIPPI